MSFDRIAITSHLLEVLSEIMSTTIGPFVMIMIKGQWCCHDILFGGMIQACFVIIVSNAESIQINRVDQWGNWQWTFGDSYKWAISWAIVNAVANPLSRTTAQFDVRLHMVPSSVKPNVSHLLSVTFFARLLQSGVLRREYGWVKNNTFYCVSLYLVRSTAAS